MHAASVHPEPGSNSRANCISTVSGSNLVCRACLALILFRVCLESVIDSRFLFQRNSRFFRTNFACTFISCCSIVNDLRKALASLRCFSHSLAIIPHSLALVKRFFKSFLKNFFAVFSWLHLACGRPARGQLAYYSTFVFICQAVFCKFFHFGALGSLS